MTSIVLFDESQSLGTVQLVPEVRKMTVASACARGNVLNTVLNEFGACHAEAVGNARQCLRFAAVALLYLGDGWEAAERGGVGIAAGLNETFAAPAGQSHWKANGGHCESDGTVRYFIMLSTPGRFSSGWPE